jgi:hypothetical protein
LGQDFEIFSWNLAAILALCHFSPAIMYVFYLRQPAYLLSTESTHHALRIHQEITSLHLRALELLAVKVGTSGKSLKVSDFVTVPLCEFWADFNDQYMFT